MFRSLLVLLLASGVHAADFVVEQQAEAIWGHDDHRVAHDLAPLDVPGVGRIDIQLSGDTRLFRLDADAPVFATETDFPGGRLLRVQDSRQRTFATVEQYLFFRDNMLPGCLLVVRDDRGRELARSDVARGIRPGFTLREASGATTALLAVGERRVRWRISQAAESTLDARVLWMIAAARTQTYYRPLAAPTR